jgi:predicted ATP-grasp superfamily ATP-dependent carboligase
MKILLVGISVRAMAESAVHSGYATIALDAFGDQDLRILSESYSLQHDFHTTYSPKALCEASRSLAFDAVAYTSNLENHADILARFTDSHRIIGNSPQAVQLVRHWPTLFAKLTQAGFSVPETIFAGDSREIDHRRQWLAKPLLSGGGHGIEFVTPDNYCIPGFMLQEYIPGKPCSASFVSNGHESVLLGITEQLIGLHQFGSQGFRYCGNVLPLPELGEPADGVKILEQANNLAAFLTQEYGLIGVNGMDFILKGDRVYLTEVNPRYSASMELIERAYELPIFHLHMQAILEGRLPEFGFAALSKNRKFFGKAVLFAERNAGVPDTRSWPEQDIRDVPLSGAKLPKGGPICTILTHNPTYNEALARLTDRAGMLKEEIYGKTDCNPDYGAFYQTGDRDFDWKGTRRISGSH